MRRRYALSLVLAIAALTFAAPRAHAADPTAGGEPGAAEADAEDEMMLAAWRSTLEQSLERATRARERVVELEGAWSRGMTRRRLRGEGRAKLVEALAEARTEVLRSTRDHEEALEEARRAGAPAGLLQDYELPELAAGLAPSDEDLDALEADGESRDDARLVETESLDDVPAAATESADEEDDPVGFDDPGTSLDRRVRKTRSLSDY